MKKVPRARQIYRPCSKCEEYRYTFMDRIHPPFILYQKIIITKKLKDSDVSSQLQNHCQICCVVNSEAKERPDLDNESFLTKLS